MAAAAAWAAWPHNIARARTDPAPPNIIYILLDDAGYGDLSCYGQTKFQTPHMDSLAEQGVRFTDHYAGSTVCAPSRCSLLTGLHTGHSAIRGNHEIQPEGQQPLPAESVTVARLLQQAGYATGAFGKWGLGMPGTSGDPLNQGFDEFFGYACQREAHNYYPDHLWYNGEKLELDGDTYSHDLIVERAFEFIRTQREQPFFCYLPVAIPHASLHVPEESAAPFREKFPEYENVTGVYRGRDITNPAACFAGMMTRLDGHVGQLLALLSELGIDDNTAVLLASDNGPHKEGGAVPDFFDSNGPFRGYKRDLYEGGIRVPFLARFPGKFSAGAVSDHPSAFWDIPATLCELAGAPAPENTDGVSLLPALTGNEDKQQKHDYLYWEFSEMPGRQAARAGQWKAVRNNVSFNPSAPVELYDLDADPGETDNVAKKHPDVRKRMKEILSHARTTSPDFPLLPEDRK